MERPDARHDAPFARGGLSERGSALVCLDDPRAELATVLVLQELGLGVDVAVDAASAIRWAARARYDVLVLGGGDGPALRRAAQGLRRVAPGARVVVLDPDEEAALTALPADVRVLRPPLDVNALMAGLASER